MTTTVYKKVRWAFAKKALGSLAHVPLGFIPNLMLHERTKLERWGLVPPALRHGPLKPISVILQVTRHCNYRCQFCIVNELVTDSDGSQALSLDEFRALLKKPLISACVRLGITGGEPLLIPHIFEIVAAAKKRIPIVTVHTNFSLVKKRLAELNASVLDMLSVSLYEPNLPLVKAFSREVSPKILRRLTFMVSMAKNFHWVGRMPEVAALAVEQGYEAIHFQNYEGPVPGVDLHSPRSENPLVHRPVPGDDETYLETKRIVERDFGSQVAIAWPVFPRSGPANGRPQCRQPDTQIKIDRDGNLSPCCSMDPKREYGSIHARESWNSDFFVQVRRGLKVEGAAVSPTCAGCPFLYHDLYDA